MVEFGIDLKGRINRAVKYRCPAVDKTENYISDKALRHSVKGKFAERQKGRSMISCA